VSYRHDATLRARVVANLGAFTAAPRVGNDLPGAAVAIVLADDGTGEAVFPFIRRGLELRSNPGQYALPGGRLDPGEGAPDAARRELAEELGITLGPESVLGVLDDFVSGLGRTITPVVLWADGPVEVVPHPDEVHAHWLVPMVELDHPEAPRWVDDPQADGPVLRMSVLGEWINPPTAAVLYQFREVALHGRTVRVRDVASPRWTHR
jgi:8-oxo-dGTP pyrophosphatase MutT (NUDIX family)